jgi:hypothetical protein
VLVGDDGSDELVIESAAVETIDQCERKIEVSMDVDPKN